MNIKRKSLSSDRSFLKKWIESQNNDSTQDLILNSKHNIFWPTGNISDQFHLRKTSKSQSQTFQSYTESLSTWHQLIHERSIKSEGLSTDTKWRSKARLPGRWTWRYTTKTAQGFLGRVPQHKQKIFMSRYTSQKVSLGPQDATLKKSDYFNNNI